MAIVKRGKTYYSYFKPYRDEKVGLKLDVTTKSEARQVEALIMRACRTGDFSMLDPVTREAAVRMHENQGWELPAGLAPEPEPEDVLTLWRAAEIFLRYPSIAKTAECFRYELCLVHLVEYFGKDKVLKDIWVPEIKTYMAERSAHASPSQVNREKGTLSKLMQVMVELRHLDTNPCRLVKNLSQRMEERQAYLSLHDVKRIADLSPLWFGPVLWTAYYSGMRRGELLDLRRQNVNLSTRVITLVPAETKERKWKRVPVHRELVPILDAAMQVTCLGTDHVFLFTDHRGTRPVNVEAMKSLWPRAVKKLGFAEPRPRFHDLRHTWRANARRSGVDPTIAESILGHWQKGRTVNERYGFISDEELVAAVDKMSFDHGETQVFVSAHGQSRSGGSSNTRGNKNATFVARKKKGQAAS